MQLTPLDIQLVGDELAIRWNDGQESYLNLEKMRRACPCASCSGEPDALGYINKPLVSYDPDRSFRLAAYGFVGGYALQPTWGDGHSTGLYTFPSLRELGQSTEESAA
jgi:DUF971 family protein